MSDKQPDKESNKKSNKESDKKTAKKPPPSWMSVGVHSFGKQYFYCLDAPNRDRPPADRGDGTPLIRRPPKPTLHEENAWKMEETVRNYTDCRFDNVRIPQNNDINALYNWFLQELASKTMNDLLIFYYHGGGGGKDENYAWKFDGPKHVYFNAYDIFKLCGESGLACMFLLDCDIQTNWNSDVKLQEPVGHVSIFARGGELRKPSGELVHDEYSFTQTLQEALKFTALDLVKDRRTRHGPCTIPQILIPAEPTWSLNRIDKIFQHHPKTPTMNIVVDPMRIRQQIAEDVSNKEVKFGRVEFLLRVTAKGGMLPPARPAPKKDTVALSQPAAEQTPAPTAVIVAPAQSSLVALQDHRKRASSVATSVDEGYVEGTDSDASTSLFIPDKRPRIDDVGDLLTAANLANLP